MALKISSMPPRAFALVAAIGLLAAACGGASSVGASTGGGATAAPAMMPLPAYAKNLKVRITAPTDGVKVTANAVALQVAATGYTPSCALAGKADQPGTGHYHVLLDKALINMYCTPTATVSLQNVQPGMHTLAVVPALNDHAEAEENAASIRIDYEPAHPLPVITDANIAGKPSITILSPRDGATVSGGFDVVVKITNFHSNCDLLGKPDVAGYGHWHVNLDAMTGPMMGMGTMLGMACTTTFHATTQGLKAGETHTIIALLTDNGHAPLNPAVASQVTVKIGG